MTFETIGSHEPSVPEFSAEEMQQVIEAHREEALARKSQYEEIIKFAETISAEIPSNEELN